MKFYLIPFLILALSSCKETQKEPIAYEPSQITSQKQDPLKESMERGGMAYTDFCMQCHMANGLGVPGVFPPLSQSNWLTEKRKESIHAVKYGQTGEIEVNGKKYNSVMVSMGLSDEEVADVLNYVMNSWGNSQKEMVTPEEVSKVLKE
ncbi:MAG: cytochrome c [Flavobacteriaceae bacterium]